MICDTCKDDFDQSECWMEDWEDAPSCIDCRVEVQEAIAASWYKTYTPADRYDEDAYDVDDPKHPRYLDTMVNKIDEEGWLPFERFAGAQFPKLVRS